MQPPEWWEEREGKVLDCGYRHNKLHRLTEAVLNLLGSGWETTSVEAFAGFSVFMERETSRWPGNTLTQLAASPMDQMEVKTFTAVTETHHNDPFMLPRPMLWGWGGVGGWVVGLFFEGCSEGVMSATRNWLTSPPSLMGQRRSKSWLNMGAEVNTFQKCCCHKGTNHYSPRRSASASPQPLHPFLEAPPPNTTASLILWEWGWRGQEAWEIALGERLLTARGLWGPNATLTHSLQSVTAQINFLSSRRPEFMSQPRF